MCTDDVRREASAWRKEREEWLSAVRSVRQDANDKLLEVERSQAAVAVQVGAALVQARGLCEEAAVRSGRQVEALTTDVRAARVEVQVGVGWKLQSGVPSCYHWDQGLRWCSMGWLDLEAQPVPRGPKPSTPSQHTLSQHLDAMHARAVNSCCSHTHIFLGALTVVFMIAVSQAILPWNNSASCHRTHRCCAMLSRNCRH